MNTSRFIALAALATTALLPRPAEAGSGDKALAAVGGFIGGVIVGAHLDRGDRYDRHPHVVVEHHTPPPVVIVDRGPRSDYHSHRPPGYWSEHTVRVWVPGRTTWTRDEWGRRVRIVERGHYEYRREKVWVDTSHRGRRW